MPETPYAASSSAMSPYAASPYTASSSATSPWAAASSTASSYAMSSSAMSPYAASPYTASSSATSPWATASSAASSYAMSPYAMSPSAASPYPASATPPSQQQRYPKTDAKAQKEMIRNETKRKLQEKLLRDFHGELPGFMHKYSSLHDVLLAQFQSCTSSANFVKKVEKEIRQHENLPDDFVLDSEERALIKRIPGQLALDYIREQRMELIDGVWVDKQDPTGYQTIAENLSAGMGYGYAKKSCEITLREWILKHQGHRHRSTHGGMAQVVTPSRRPHNPEVDVPSKMPRRSQEHLSPGQSPSAIPLADADRVIKDAIMNNTTDPTMKRANSILSRPPTLLSDFYLNLAKQAHVDEIKAELEEKFAQKKLQDEKDLEARAAKIDSIGETLLRACEEHKTEKAALCDHNKQLIAQLDADNDTIKKLQAQVGAMKDETQKLRAQVEAIAKTSEERIATLTNMYETLLSEKTIQPPQMHNTPGESDDPTQLFEMLDNRQWLDFSSGISNTVFNNVDQFLRRRDDNVQAEGSS